MISPTKKLLVVVALFSMPIAAVIAVMPEATPLAIGVVAVLAVVLLIDGSLGLGRPARLRVTVAQDMVRLTKDRPTEIPLLIENERARVITLRIGLTLPLSFESDEETMTVILPAANAVEHRWPCTARERGQFAMQEVYFEVCSPLGLWAVRGFTEHRTELRVYPNLMHERNRLSAIFLNRGFAGAHTQRQVGKGREFAQLRDYIPGDSFEDIHWKATARRARLVTKMHQVERTQEVYVIIDASRLSARSTGDVVEGGERTSHLELFITAALVLGMVAERQGDLFGLVTFSNRVHSFIRAKRGHSHFNTCRDALYTLQPNVLDPDFGELVSFLRLRLRRRALLVFLTDLDDSVLAESFVNHLQLLQRHHLMVVNTILPKEVGPLFSSAKDVSSNEDIYTKLGGHVQWRQLREVQRGLYRHGVTMGLLQDSAFCPDTVSQYMNIKQRQLL